MKRAAGMLIAGFSLIAAVVFLGCKAAPAPSVGFADPKEMKSDPTVPFNKFYRNSNVNWKQYDKIYVAEVNTAYMLKMTDWQKGERKDQIQKDVQQLRDFTRNSIEKSFRDDPKHRFEVVDGPTHEAHTIVLEFALIEVVPSKVTLNALGYAPFFVGTGITVVRSIANDKSFAAFEARVEDASSGQVLLLAADRESEQYAPIDVRGLTWYSDAEGIINDWSKQFVEVANQKPGEVIKGSDTFRLQPW
jgi:Protein of unknown function (DUF3313)